MRRHHTPDKHKLASVTLAVACLLPVVVVLTYLGIWLDRHPGELSLSFVFVIILMLVVLIPVLMFLGAALWLAVARFIVPREVSEKFFIYPGFGIISGISRWLFERAYEKDADV